MTTGSKVLLALLGGAVVGATAALLMAPKSGSELRTEIAAIAREKYSHMNLDEISRVVLIVRFRSYEDKVVIL
jgi:gas vesicle protein